MTRVANTGRHESASKSPGFRPTALPLQGTADPLRAIPSPALSPAAPERAEAKRKTKGKAPRPALHVLASAVVFALAFAAATHTDLFDRPVTVLINQLAGHSDLFDRLVSVVYWYPTFTGAPLMALVWACWFEDEDFGRRSRILLGTLAAAGAGFVSRLLQHALPTHPRPYYDAVIHFHMPLSQEQLLNTWHSFPSDHVAVFGGLLAVLFVARSRLAFPMLIYTAVMELPRIYMGAHYPSDLIAGAALAFMCVWAVQVPSVVAVGARIVAWERSHRPAFYATAFFLSYQVAMLFTELRSAGSLLMHQVLQP